MPTPIVEATSLAPTHTFHKLPQTHIDLLPNHGVVGDAHAGPTTEHLYLKRKHPAKPNLTQVHLLPAELLDQIETAPGELGENLLTRHLDLHALPTEARLQIGEVTLEITGYRTPCIRIYKRRPGLLHHFLLRKAPNCGIMAIVLTPGTIRPGDPIHLTLPPEPHRPLRPV